VSSEHAPDGQGERSVTGQPDESGQHLNTRTITDPLAMRALAHPIRIALLEALAQAGTLTATQASQLLGESPANCAFHLRTLAKYGYVEEAGGGRGRERPWRRVHESLRITSEQDDPRAAQTADEVGMFFMEAAMERARTALSTQASWPAEWRHRSLGGEQVITWLTPDEARKLRDDTSRLLEPYFDRADYPEKRPADAMPVEIIRLSYLLMHLANQSRPAGPGKDQPGTGQPA
jgi:predicted ArsR family transcriptional regulator